MKVVAILIVVVVKYALIGIHLALAKLHLWARKKEHKSEFIS